MKGVFNFIESAPPVPTQDDFSITQGLAYMQRGLSAAYDYSDFIYVIDLPAAFQGDSKVENDQIKSFKKGLAQIYKATLPKDIVPTKAYLQKITTQELVTISFDTDFWNRLNINNVDSYKPTWTLPQDKRKNKVAEGFPERKKDFYKFNIKMLFQIKKCQKGDNQLSMKIQDLLSDHGFKFFSVQGDSQQFCGTYNAVIGGRFNDGLQKPKDPYNFFLHCLVGYDRPQHVGGSYLVVQKCIFDWMNIHISHESLNLVMGRNDIKNGSNIFSQHHCPRSHIKLSRIKDQQGNSVTMHRQSKGFTTANFDAVANRDSSDNISPEEGLFFLAYHKNPFVIQKMLLNQMGNNNNPSFDDGLLNNFHTQHGNILYVPNIFEITGLSLKSPDINPTISDLCQYHETRWLKHFQRNEADEQNHKKTGNPYYLYSRAGYMKKMTYSHQYDKQLNPPSPRIMRLLSKTFSMWQDTWYFDRSQREFPHLQEFVQKNHNVLEELHKKVGFDFNQFKKYTDYPMAIRNGLAIHFNLGHVVSTKQFGCRGPSSDPHGKFGSNTFHLQPEDLLAGGGPNLSFGQGKHLVEYLTTEQMKIGWMKGQNLSAHSGIGHVNPYLQQIMEIGLDKLIAEFQAKADSFKGKDQGKYNIFIASVFALLGMQKYLLNYAQLAQDHINKLGPKQVAAKKSFEKIRDNMNHLAHKPPIAKNLHQGVQIILSVYNCLQLTGEPVSIGRLDYSLRKFANTITQKNYQPTQQQQDIIDAFWIKVGQKANFNKSFFEDHQKWGNIGIGGSSLPFPQGSSFNQWGQQVVIGGTNVDDSPFYNSLTIACLRAARRLPFNAPCLGLRVQKKTPQFIIHEATKTLLAGGAHPVLLNDQKVIAGLERCGNYVIKKQVWEKDPLLIDGKSVNVPYEHWNPLVKKEDRYDFGSDGCHQFLPIGKTWFWLGGGSALQPLQYILNEGKNLISSGPRYIHGQRQTFRYKKNQEYQTFQQFEKEYFQIFEEMFERAYTGQLSGFANMSKICPATLLNAFTADMRKRQSDFYEGGATYRFFAMQYSGLPNLINSLWNIKTLVFEQRFTTLKQIRNVLLLNWGDQMDEPFVSRNLPPMLKVREKERYDTLRQFSWRQPKFGVDPQVTAFGLYIARKMTHITRKIFQQPNPGLLNLFKTLTYRFASKQAPFGFQYVPGAGTFENYCDLGAFIGASFDGRKKGQPVSDDFSPQNLPVDIDIRNNRYNWQTQPLENILNNYSYQPVKFKNQPVNINHFYNKDPQLMSGAPLNLNIDQDYDPDTLAHNIYQIAQGAGPNTVTISVGTRKILEEAKTNTDLDLIRFRLGGWSQFAIAMFPQNLQQNIRRLRNSHKKVQKPVLKKIDDKRKQSPQKH